MSIELMLGTVRKSLYIHDPPYNLRKEQDRNVQSGKTNHIGVLRGRKEHIDVVGYAVKCVICWCLIMVLMRTSTVTKAYESVDCECSCVNGYRDVGLHALSRVVRKSLGE
jgi:hypothetical protein